MVTKSKKEKKRVAPYVPVSVLSGFLDRIRRISTPPQITSRDLHESGVSNSDSFALLSTLRFLNLIDEQGVPTPEFRSLQTSGDEFKHNLEQVVRNAYSDLFAWLDPAVDDREHVRNFFARSYSPATAEKATAVFLDLCGESEIPLKEERPKKEAVSPRPKRPVTRPSTRRETPPVPEGEAQPISQSPQLAVRIDSKDFASMEPEQIRSFFEGLSKVIAKETEEAKNQKSSEE